MTQLVSDARMGSMRRPAGRSLAAARTAALLAVILVAPAAAQAPAMPPAAQPLDSYAEAAATTIIAEQSCPGVQVKAGQLTTLRLAARVGPAQEAALEKLRSRSSQIRQQLAADGRDAWCAAALAAFGPAGTVARGVLATGVPTR